MNGTGALWLGAGPLVLASGSMIRRQMLEMAGIPVVVRPIVVDEASIANRLVGEKADVRTIAIALARAKGSAASGQWPDDLVLTADQTLEFEGRLGMKPASAAEARSQLSAMRGRTHRLHAAACLSQNGQLLWEGCATATLIMRAFSDGFLDAYLAQMGEQVCRTVGAYEFEALGAHLFGQVEGEHAAILGLPLRALLAAMRRLGLLLC